MVETGIVYSFQSHQDVKKRFSWIPAQSPVSVNVIRQTAHCQRHDEPWRVIVQVVFDDFDDIWMMHLALVSNLSFETLCQVRRFVRRKGCSIQCF